MHATLALMQQYGFPAVHRVQLDTLQVNLVAVRDHCYGCTAGDGSSCGGALRA